MVVYSAQDREFADPVLKAYEKLAGVEILPKFDVESSKTVGLANDIIAEKARPLCDLFWNNEILNTLRLKEKGLLAPFQPIVSCRRRSRDRSSPRMAHGTGSPAARFRILIVNTKLVPEADRPKGIKDPIGPQMEGEDRDRQAALRHDGHSRRLPVCCVGRRESHAILARDLKANGVQVPLG